MAEEKPKKSRAKIIIWCLTVLLTVALGLGGYLFYAYQKALVANPVEERRRLVETIGRAVLLPAEEPQVATVQNASKLANKVLAAKTQDGDKLLVYASAKQIFIYRPSSQKLVDILQIQDNDAAIQ
jgi:hypothetical protein